MSVGPGAHNLQPPTDRYERLAAQRAADHLDQRLRKMREVANGLVLDFLALAIGAPPQQMRRVHPAFVATPCGDDMTRLVSATCEITPQPVLETLDNARSADYRRFRRGEELWSNDARMPQTTGSPRFLLHDTWGETECTA